MSSTKKAPMHLRWWSLSAMAATAVEATGTAAEAATDVEATGTAAAVAAAAIMDVGATAAAITGTGAAAAVASASFLVAAAAAADAGPEDIGVGSTACGHGALTTTATSLLACEVMTS